MPKINHPYNDKNIQIYDATLDGKYPVMAASFIKKNNIILTFGSDFNKEKAINKAYIELFQGRNDFENIGTITDNISECVNSFNLERHFISSDGDVHKDIINGKFKNLKWKFKEKFDYFEEFYIRDYSYKNYYAFHLIVPGVSEVYPIDDLIYNNKNRGKFYRDFVLNPTKYSKLEITEKLNELNPFLDIGKFIGVEFEEKINVRKFKENPKKQKLSQRYLNILKYLHF